MNEKKEESSKSTATDSKKPPFITGDKLYKDYKKKTPARQTNADESWGLKEFITLGALGFFMWYSLKNNQHEKENEDLKAAISVYKVKNRKLQTDMDELSGLSEQERREFRNKKNSKFSNPFRSEPTQTIWLD